MRPDRLPSWEQLNKVMQIVLDEAVSTETVVLKLHLLAESHLYRLLALRLEMDEEQLPTLQFFVLAKLGLGGDLYKATLIKVLALNDLRNEFSHELDEQRLIPSFERFCARTNMFWPPADVLDKPAEFAALRKSAVTSGAIVAVMETWCHFGELFAKKYESQLPSPGELRGIIAKSKGLLEETRRTQNSVRKTFEGPGGKLPPS
jgi:hypothetical protein